MLTDKFLKTQACNIDLPTPVQTHDSSLHMPLLACVAKTHCTGDAHGMQSNMLAAGLLSHLLPYCIGFGAVFSLLFQGLNMPVVGTIELQ